MGLPVVGELRQQGGDLPAPALRGVLVSHRCLWGAVARDPQYWLTGTYQLVDAEINCVVVSGSQDGYGLSLDEVAEQLEAER